MRPAIVRYAYVFALALSGCVFAQSQPAAETIVQVDVRKTANYSIPRSIFGTFLEPIGNSTYNGLWAELLQNPSFEDSLWDVKHVADMVKDDPRTQSRFGNGLASSLGTAPVRPRLSLCAAVERCSEFLSIIVADGFAR